MNRTDANLTPILLILSLLTHTLMINLKIKIQHKIVLNLFAFTHHHLISSLTFLAVSHT